MDNEELLNIPKEADPVLSDFVASLEGGEKRFFPRYFSWKNLGFAAIGLICAVFLYFCIKTLQSFSFSEIFSTREVQNSPSSSSGQASSSPNDSTGAGAVPAKNTGIQNCGNSTAPSLNDPSTYENDPVLSCLGASAVYCTNAAGILEDNFFPTLFQITNNQGVCSFKLSYREDSTLVDITGKKLAGQYISCPIDIVKATDNTASSASVFTAPDKTDLRKYASQIYFYGTLGLFVENNLDVNKIQALGCKGDYIQSIIASYSAAKAK